MSIEDFQSRLGYTFRNVQILQEALTHPSYGHELRQHAPDNQRLEFLGDAVLQLAVTQRLYEVLPHESEGPMTMLRARLVNRSQLHSLAEQIDLGSELVLGKGEELNSGRTRSSNLADAMEAVIGAVFLDAGWETARDLVLRLLNPEIAQIDKKNLSENPKGDLQEFLQTKGGEPPEYICESESGPAHARIFEVSVHWQGQKLGSGSGPSKKEAEINAARAALTAHSHLESLIASDHKPS
jgi:ribonuclease III